MPVRTWPKAIWASVCAAVLAVPGSAQAPARNECNAQVVLAQTDVAARRHPRNFYARVKADVDAKRFRRAVEALIRDFDRDGAIPEGDTRRRALRSRLVVMRDAVDAVDAAYDVSTGGVPPNFAIAANPATGAFEVFPDDADRVVITNATPAVERRALCWTAISAEQIRADVRRPALVEAVRIMRETRRHWRNYQDQGYSMYPWESLLLSVPGIRKCIETNLGPPKCAPIFMHANGSWEVSGLGKPGDEGWTDLRSRAGVSWDVIGFVHYGRDWRTYWGLAAVLVTSADQKPAFGPAIHFGKAVEVAAVFRGGETGATGSRRSLLLSVDAYKALVGLPGRYAAARDKVERAIEAGAGLLGGGGSPPP